MRTVLVKDTEFIKSNWSGGETLEMAIFPLRSQYINRDFIWRLSSATIDDETSDFTVLDDFQRSLAVLEGEVILNLRNEETLKLHTFETIDFDGSWDVKSYGKIRDLNLMVRKGAYGNIKFMDLESTAASLDYILKKDCDLMSQCIYVVEGYVLVNVDGSDCLVNKNQVLIIEGDMDENLSYTVMGEGKIALCQIEYSSSHFGETPEEIDSKKPTFDDFKCALFLSNVQFRVAKYIFKSLKKLWFDPALSTAIEKVESLYLTTAIMFFGVVVLASLCSYFKMSGGAFLFIILLWIILDLALISPLVYLIFLPKPVRPHMKEISKLTPYEAKLREEELSTNKRVDKLLKKYKYKDPNDHK